MALVYPSYAGLILSNTVFVGPQAPQMANGIALGLTTYLLTNPLNIVSSIGDIGAPGSGVGNGIVIPPPIPVLTGLLTSNLAGVGIIGPQAPQMALGLSIATSTYLMTAQSLTAHAGVGLGTGVGNIIGVEPIGMAASILSVTGFIGPQWPQIVAGISNALVTYLMSSVKFTITITGPAGPGMSTGVGSGRLL
jgi:hypothetical protein